MGLALLINILVSQFPKHNDLKLSSKELDTKSFTISNYSKVFIKNKFVYIDDVQVEHITDKTILAYYYKGTLINIKRNLSRSVYCRIIDSIIVAFLTYLNKTKKITRSSYEIIYKPNLEDLLKPSQK